MKSKKIKRVVIPIIILSLCALSVISLNYMLMPKRTDGIITIKSLYAQEDNTIDVLFLGSSYTGMNIDIAELWSEYGYSAFNLWGSVQPFWNTYYFLLEALKTQSPKVILLDVYAAFQSFEYSDTARQVTNTAGMKFSTNKIKAVMASTDKSNFFNLLIGFPLYNNRIIELNSEDWQYYFNKIDLKSLKGNSSRSGSNEAVVLEDVSEINEVKHIHPKEKEYLLKIIQLCKLKNIPLVLIKTPSSERVIEQPYYNEVKLIAQSNNLDFYNLNLLDTEIGLSSLDFWTDDCHLNTDGSKKITRYISENILSKYNLPNHKGDIMYSSWDKNCLEN